MTAYESGRVRAYSSHNLNRTEYSLMVKLDRFYKQFRKIFKIVCPSEACHIVIVLTTFENQVRALRADSFGMAWHHMLPPRGYTFNVLISSGIYNFRAALVLLTRFGSTIALKVG